MNIYIVRHGESEGNVREFISFSFTPLTAKGHKDAKKLGRKLSKEKIKIDRLYCSTLYRSLQTLEEILDSGLKIDRKKIELTDLVREINRKEFEGENREVYYSNKNASNSPDDYCCKDGESENDVKKRAENFFKLINKKKDENIMIVSHGHFFKHFLSLLGLYDLGHLNGVTLSLIKVIPKKTEVIFWNDMKHLEQK